MHLSILLLLSLSLQALAGTPDASAPALAPAPSEYRSGFLSIGTEEIRAQLGFIASPELAGRATGTPGYDTAARYVASQLESYGVTPGGEQGTYFQHFRIVWRNWLQDQSSLKVEGPGDQRTEIPLKDAFAVLEPGGRGPGSIDWSAPWLFVGHGESGAFDGPDDLHGLDLADKVVLLLPRPGVVAHEDEAVRRRGARQIVVISDERVRSRVGVWIPAAPLPPAEGKQTPEPQLDSATVYLGVAQADRLLGLRGLSVARLLAGPLRPAPLALEGLRIRLSIPLATEVRSTRNVVGIMEGRDPLLRKEVVAIGAHLDHVGTEDGKIFAGADDDGSGVVAVLAAARAFSRNGLRPRRSVAFLFFAAEEMGLHGSEYFASRPPFSLEDLVLELQLDMVGRDEEHPAQGETPAERPEDNRSTLHLVGSRRCSLELDPWIERVNRATGLHFENDEERVYERSDQYNFGRRGVPVVFFFAGFHPDYHQPTDTPEKINYEKLTKVSRLAFSLAWEVADRPERLRKNRL